MSKEALIIIDMQPEFFSSRSEKLKRPILKEIETAKKKRAPIVVVEYRSYYTGRILYNTHKYIKEALADYKNKKTVGKNFNDGSSDINKFFTRNNLNKQVRVCGVNTSCCVLQTVAGLYYLGYKIKTLADCTNDEHEGDHKNGLRSLKKYSKVIRKGKALK